MTHDNFSRFVFHKPMVVRYGLVGMLLIGLLVPALQTPAAVSMQFPTVQPTVQQQEVFDTMTTTRVERILRSFTDVQWRELDNNDYLIQLSDGLKIRLVKRDKSLMLSAAWGGQRMTLSRINEWNRAKRFAKAYLDDENDPVLESDYELTGGVTEQNIKEWMKTFVYFAKEFQKYMNE
ncbi:MAG: YbjN domain-containing protein [Chloracidobacterium sp.]|nr:YbjN domain-containing protein [Chloracidobacterium sp.]MDW8217015.1 YbjN domain-containing protein [Acidobacteriota bacterium]